jgi:hypothetical protein
LVALFALGVAGIIAAPSASAAAPGITFTAGPTGVVDTQSAAFTFTINRKPNAIRQLSCILDGVPGACGSISPSGGNGSASGVSYSGLAAGAHTLLVRVTLTDGGTASASRSWTVRVTLLNVTDPAGDDNGPGTFAYPTSPDFHPGAFDLTRFGVLADGTSVTLRVQLRDLSPTFGATDGAQLLDIYVRNPAAATTSTAAAFSSRNYTIASSSAWSERIEIQAFAPPVFVDALGNSLGVPGVSADSTAAQITITVPETAFGQPGTGWIFTVVLTGQDGSSPDQARGFAPAPQPFLFGLCSPGGSSPICFIDPATAPKAIDVITPPGVSQSTELDPTRGPVTLNGVAIP